MDDQNLDTANTPDAGNDTTKSQSVASDSAVDKTAPKAEEKQSTPTSKRKKLLISSLGLIVLLCICCLVSLFAFNRLVPQYLESLNDQTDSSPVIDPQNTETENDGDGGDETESKAPINYMINCRLYRYDETGLNEITYQMKGYVADKPCYTQARIFDEQQEIIAGYKIDFAKMQALKVGLGEAAAATINPITGQIYTLEVKSGENIGVYSYNTSGGDRKLFASFPEYTVWGRGMALSDQSSISFSPDGELLMVSNSMISKKTSAGEGFGIKIIDKQGKIIKSFPRYTHGTWTSAGKFAYWSGNVQDTAATEDQKLYLYDLTKNNSKLVIDKQLIPTDVSAYNNRLYVTTHLQVLDDSIPFQSFIYSIDGSGEVGSKVYDSKPAYFTRDFGDKQISFNIMACGAEVVKDSTGYAICGTDEINAINYTNSLIEVTTEGNKTVLNFPAIVIVSGV